MQTALTAAEVQPLLRPAIVETQASPPYDCTKNYDFQNDGPMQHAELVPGDPLCRPPSLWNKVRRSDVRCSLQGTPKLFTAAQYMIQKVQRTKETEEQDQLMRKPVPSIQRSCPCSPTEVQRMMKGKRLHLSPPASARQYAMSSLKKHTRYSLSISSDEEDTPCLASTKRNDAENKELHEGVSVTGTSVVQKPLLWK
ncbi:Hypp369 [Branchiostoma lanceolatum]|uniref:Hypp369 protein n=1 Tax=Branchiostoma lanceolatum TaxID=7740 RepID=A0A8J9VYX7_BRALA|nr:Hypp369 [Branchiostoma lanceolatum]